MGNWYTIVPEPAMLRNTNLTLIGKILLEGKRQTYECGVLLGPNPGVHYVVCGWDREAQRFTFFFPVANEFLDVSTNERILNLLKECVILWEQYHPF